MIVLSKLQKVVGQSTVIEIPQLRVDSAEISALIGPEGSGNTILLQLLTGRTRPSAGSILIANVDPADDKTAFSRLAGVLFAEDTLYKNRSARSNLTFHARLRGLPETRVDRVLEQVGLRDQASTRVDKLGTGLTRRLAFGIAILHQPATLILVEPFARCDEATITLLTQLIQAQANDGSAVLILTATDSYMASLCDAMYTLDQGRIVAERRPKEEEPASALPFKIPVRREGSIVLVNPSDILMAQVEDGRTSLLTGDSMLPTQYTLTELEQRLARSGFFRAHRSYLVNLQHVTEVIPFTRSSFSLRLDDPAGTIVPLSRDAARELRELLDY